MPSSISRRSLAKGAAWALPTVAIASAAPAFAASQATPAYLADLSYASRFRTATGTQCYELGAARGYLNSLEFSNYDETMMKKGSTSPLGFAIVNDTASNGTESPQTSATVTKYVFQVAFPAAMVNRSVYANGIKSTSGDSANYTVTSNIVNMTNPKTNVTEDMIVYTMTYTGPTTQQTVSDSTSSRIPAWSGTRIGLVLDTASNVCMNPDKLWYWTSVDTTFTTVNGFDGSLRGSGWDQMPAVAP